MKKKITAMLLAICCISSTWTVYADDFSSGSSEVEIEITEDEDADVDDVEITEDADANDEMFSDGTESSTSGGDISAMANQIVARAEIQAQEYQQLKKEAKKYADAQEVARRAQEIKEETARIRKQALKEAARRKECGESPGSRGFCSTVCWQSICMGRNKPHERCRLLWIRDVCICKLWL